jgi:hypothetical protein
VLFRLVMRGAIRMRASNAQVLEPAPSVA